MYYANLTFSFASYFFWQIIYPTPAMIVKSSTFLSVLTLLLFSLKESTAQDPTPTCTVPMSSTCFASTSGKPPPEITCCSITSTAGAEPRTCLYDNRILITAISSIHDMIPTAAASLSSELTDALDATIPCPTEGLRVPTDILRPIETVSGLSHLAATITSCLIYPTCTCG